MRSRVRFPTLLAIIALAFAAIMPAMATGPIDVYLLIPATLGDKGFNDSAKAGLDMIAARYGSQVTTRYTELGTDTAKHAPALEDAGAEGYEIVLCSNAVRNALMDIAPRYPKTLYVMYDGWIDGDIPNVYSIQYRNSEAGYLAGALAGLMAKTTKSQGAAGEATIGFVGGRDIGGINDFLVGYIAGARKVDPGVRVVTSYVNSFTDTAKAKDQALVQYSAFGAAVIYHAAARAGLGVFEAAVERGAYAIGVDTDQAALFGKEPQKAQVILSSTLKRVDMSLLNAVRRYMEGEKLGGRKVWMGAAEGAIALAPYAGAVPQTVKKELEALLVSIKGGSVQIPSALEMSYDAIASMRESVAPRRK